MVCRWHPHCELWFYYVLRARAIQLIFASRAADVA